MPREYKNFNNVGKVSGLLVLLLAFLAVNPVMTAVYAEEEVSSDEADEISVVNASHDFGEVEDGSDEVANLASTTIESIVGVSFSPVTYRAELAPTNSAGQSARIDLSATISVHDSGGYYVYLKSSDVNLVGASNSSNVIPGATTAKTYTNMDVNTWGYASAVDTDITSSNTYKKVSVSGNGDTLASNTNTQIVSDTKKINLSFAAKINDAKPADTYSNTMMLSVVSSPRVIVTFAEKGVTTMQEMTSAACSAATVGHEAQLKDVRDGKYYWVSKLADGKCWMTQNLDLDLNASTTPLTSATSDVSTDWTPRYNSGGGDPVYTATVASADTVVSSNTAQRSWSLGNYRITNPTVSSSCGSVKASAADCPSQFTAYTTPTTANNDARAHYILGNHYQWNTATAGTGGIITSGQASSSICPKGWRLPTGASSGEFQALVTTGGIGSSVTKITSSPYYFVRGGFISPLTNALFSDAGNGANYWSSTSNSNIEYAYSLIFYGADGIAPSFTDGRLVGRSVRCVAR